MAKSDNTFNFTAARLEKLVAAPAKKRLVYYDAVQRNLCLIVTDTGNKAFYIRRTVNGRPVRFHIGRFPDIKIEKARDLAIGFLEQIASGKNPMEARRQQREELTLTQLFEEYLNGHAKLHKKSWAYEERLFQRLIAPSFGGRLIGQLAQDEVLRWHHKIGEQSGRVIANRAIALLTLLYNKADEWGFVKDRYSPTRHIRKFKEKSRERFLVQGELPRFLAALHDMPEGPRDYVLVSLLTGARKSNVLSMSWQEIDWERSEWHIPETKNGDPMTVPLVPEVMDILKRRKGTAINMFVFPGTGQTGHVVSPKKSWKTLLHRAGISNLTIHDMRRTLGSWQTIMGATPYVVGKSLGHKDPKSTQVYARMDIQPVRDSMTRAADAILGKQPK